MACRREGISPCVLAQPGMPARVGSVTLHDHGFGSRGSSAMSRTRPITRPSKMATPSVPGALSGKIRRQTMLEAFNGAPSPAFAPLALKAAFLTPVPNLDAGLAREEVL